MSVARRLRRRGVELSGCLGISHLVGHHAITGRTYSTKEILIGSGPTGTSMRMGAKSAVRVRFKDGGIGMRMLSMGRAIGGRSMRDVCGCL